jgi:hypothetical protein
VKPLQGAVLCIQTNSHEATDQDRAPRIVRLVVTSVTTTQVGVTVEAWEPI